MEITTVIGCKVQCTFCPQTLLMERYEEQNNLKGITWGNPIIMSFTNFKNYIDKIPTNIDILFSGYAEPWLNPECTKMLLYAYEKGHTISAYSTLVGMTTDDVEQFKHVKFKKFEIHLPDIEKYAKIAINQNYLTVLTRILSSNILNLSSMTMGTIPEEIQTIIQKNFPANKMIDRAGNNDFGIKTPMKFGPIYCKKAHVNGKNTLNSNTLLPNGDVTLCCMDYGMDNILGNLIESNYESLFKSETAQNILSKMNSDHDEIMCRKCSESVSTNPDTKLLGEKYSTESKQKFMEVKSGLNNLYRELLRRDVDEEGLNYFMPLLIDQKISFDDVQQSIINSDEYKRIFNV
jgi:hypothetical protein